MTLTFLNGVSERWLYGAEAGRARALNVNPPVILVSWDIESRVEKIPEWLARPLQLHDFLNVPRSVFASLWTRLSSSLWWGKGFPPTHPSPQSNGQCSAVSPKPHRDGAADLKHLDYTTNLTRLQTWRPPDIMFYPLGAMNESSKKSYHLCFTKTT